MAHPYHMHREHQVSHRRVAPLMKEEPAGAMKHAKGNPFSKVTSKTAAENPDDIGGKSMPKRYARGGKVKGHGKGGNTTNIVIASHKPQPTPVPVPVPAGGPGGPPPGGPPMMPPGAGGPPGMPPGGPPMPMRAKGGRVDGESTKENIEGWSSRAAKNSYAKGGKVMAGAMSGEGRLEKAKNARGK
jgi:hypothetical protein